MVFMFLQPTLHERGDLVVREGDFTIADRDALPEDGRRHELLDGVLLMSPAPRLRHQEVVGNLHVLLKTTAPADLRVVLAPFDVRYGERTAIQPDLVVARKADTDANGFTRKPLLAVEVASSSTRFFDLGRKRELLAELGCPSYWTIEPDGAEDGGPEITVWTLDGGAFRRERVLTGQDPWTARAPFAVTLSPAALLDD